MPPDLSEPMENTIPDLSEPMENTIKTMISGDSDASKPARTYDKHNENGDLRQLGCLQTHENA